jgi:pimeloyl-ACP methyl ester carboxylesterase
VTETLQANGIEIAYETFGDPDARPLVMVMGLNTQMIAWPDELCEDLAKAGHWVIRYDNRDIGESTHFKGVKTPPIAALASRRTKPPYSVADMGRDLLGVLDGLGVESAHVVGASMGGYIAQAAALEAPQRIRSMTLMMTSTGSRLVGRTDLRLIPRLLTRNPIRDREAAGQAAVDTFRNIGSRGFEFDEEWYREIGRRSFDRSHDVGGYRRQLAACLAQPDRTRALRKLDTPALVIHGLGDPLVAPTGGLALARALKNSRFLGIPGMGHDLPRALWPEFASAITALTERAED